MSTQDLRPSRIRQFAFYTSVLLFLITTTAVILYGSGYVLHLPSRSIIATGSLLVKTQPTAVKSVVAGEAYDETTPLRIAHLIPRTIPIRIEKDGYFPWQKQLEILPKQTTFVETVLFRIAPPQKISEHSATSTNFLSPNGTLLLHFTPGDTYITVTENGNTHVVPLKNNQELDILTIQWNANGSHALLSFRSASTVTHASYILSVARPRELFEPLEQRGLTPIRWDIQQPWMLIVTNKKKTFQMFHSLSHELTSYITMTSTDEPLPFDPTQFEKVVQDKDKEIVFFNAVEIWHKKKEDSYSLLMRSAEKISRVLPVPNAPYAAVLVGGKIILVEYDDRDTRNRFIVAPEYTFTDIALTTNGNAIRAYGKHTTDEGTAGMYEIPIR